MFWSSIWVQLPLWSPEQMVRSSQVTTRITNNQFKLESLHRWDKVKSGHVTSGISSENRAGGVWWSRYIKISKCDSAAQIQIERRRLGELWNAFLDFDIEIVKHKGNNRNMLVSAAARNQFSFISFMYEQVFHLIRFCFLYSVLIQSWHARPYYTWKCVLVT